MSYKVENQKTIFLSIKLMSTTKGSNSPVFAGGEDKLCDLWGGEVNPE